jgi:hypothetical protein
MGEIINFIDPLVEKAETYGKTSYELIKLRTIGKTAEIASTFASRGAAILVLSMFTLIVNIGLALWLGELLGKNYYGFFTVAGFYGTVGIILYFFMHDPIKKRVSNSIISQILN